MLFLWFYAILIEGVLMIIVEYFVQEGTPIKTVRILSRR